MDAMIDKIERIGFWIVEKRNLIDNKPPIKSMPFTNLDCLSFSIMLFDFLRLTKVQKNCEKLIVVFYLEGG